MKNSPHFRILLSQISYQVKVTMADAQPGRQESDKENIQPGLDVTLSSPPLAAASSSSDSDSASLSRKEFSSSTASSDSSLQLITPGMLRSPARVDLEKENTFQVSTTSSHLALLSGSLSSGSVREISSLSSLSRMESPDQEVNIKVKLPNGEEVVLGQTPMSQIRPYGRVETSAAAAPARSQLRAAPAHYGLQVPVRLHVSNLPFRYRSVI